MDLLATKLAWKAISNNIAALNENFNKLFLSLFIYFFFTNDLQRQKCRLKCQNSHLRAVFQFSSSNLSSKTSWAIEWKGLMNEISSLLSVHPTFTKILYLKTGTANLLRNDHSIRPIHGLLYLISEQNLGLRTTLRCFGVSSNP